MGKLTITYEDDSSPNMAISVYDNEDYWVYHFLVNFLNYVMKNRRLK